MNNRYPAKVLLFALFVPATAFIACTKTKDLMPKEPDSVANAKTTTISKAIPEIGLKISYSFSMVNDTSFKVEVSDNYIFIDNNATFYAPESTEYFTIRCQSKKDTLSEYFVNGKYHADTKKLEIYYVKASTKKL